MNAGQPGGRGNNPLFQPPTIRPLTLKDRVMRTDQSALPDTCRIADALHVAT